MNGAATGIIRMPGDDLIHRTRYGWNPPATPPQDGSILVDTFHNTQLRQFHKFSSSDRIPNCLQAQRRDHKAMKDIGILLAPKNHEI